MEEESCTNTKGKDRDEQRVERIVSQEVGTSVDDRVVFLDGKNN